MPIALDDGATLAPVAPRVAAAPHAHVVAPAHLGSETDIVAVIKSPCDVDVDLDIQPGFEADFNFAVDCGFTHSSAANFAAANEAMLEAMQAEAIKASIVSASHQNATAATSVLLFDDGQLVSHDVVAAIGSAAEHPNVVALANLHAAALLRGTEGSSSRSVATEDFAEQLIPGTPDYSDTSSISVEVVNERDTETPETDRSHAYQAEVYSVLGANRSHPESEVYNAYWNRLTPGSRPTTPVNGTLAHVLQEIRAGYWFDPEVRQWLPPDWNPVQELVAPVESSNRKGFALCDNGATIDCSVDGIGNLEGTYTPDGGNYDIGNKKRKLKSRGRNYHALTLVDKTGFEYDELRRMYDTPDVISNILSECQEMRIGTDVVSSGSTGTRTWLKPDGTKLALHTTPNYLGWLKIKPITDPDRLQRLLDKTKILTIVNGKVQHLVAPIAETQTCNTATCAEPSTQASDAAPLPAASTAQSVRVPRPANVSMSESASLQ